MRESYPQSHVFHGDPTLDPNGNMDHYTAPTTIWNKQPTKMTTNDKTSFQQKSLSQRLDDIEATLKQIAASIKPSRYPTRIPMAKRFGEWLAEQNPV